MRALLLTSLLLALAGPARADDAEARRHLAGELLQVLDSERELRRAASDLLDLQLETNPSLAPFQDVLYAFIEETVRWEAIEPRLVELYAETYSVRDLRAALRFYRSPAGQRFAAHQGRLHQAATGIAEQLLIEREAELQRRLQARASRLLTDLQSEGEPEDPAE